MEDGPVTGSERRINPDGIWYPLIDLATDRVVGAIRRDGEVRSDDPEVVARVEGAYRRELLTRNGEVIEELGVCYADVVTLSHGAPDHDDLVFRNLALLAGYLPGDPDSASPQGA
jgi:hypothetical protein